MIVISDHELGTVCDSPSCTRQAIYVVTVNFPTRRYVRLYCPKCTAEFLQGAVKVLRGNESLHDYVQTEHLVKGASINA